MTTYPPLIVSAAPDSYTPAATLTCPGSHKLRIQVSNAPVYIQFGGGIGGQQWEPEQPYLTVTGTLIQDFDAVRVRNYTAGQVAQAILTPVV